MLLFKNQSVPVSIMLQFRNLYIVKIFFSPKCLLVSINTFLKYLNLNSFKRVYFTTLDARNRIDSVFNFCINYLSVRLNFQHTTASKACNHFHSYDPTLTYGVAKDPQKPMVESNFVALDGKCLSFTGYTKETIPKPSVYPYRIRHVKIIYYLVDDTISITERTVEVGFFRILFLLNVCL